MTEYLTGKSNPLFKHIRKLRADRTYRYEHGEYLADGTKLVEEALRWNTVHAIVCTQGVEAGELPAGVRSVTVPSAVMKDLSRMDTPQGMLAVCAMPPQPALRLTPGCLILDGIQDPGNLGTILRTADALDTPVILTDGCADPFGEKTVRASMGAVMRNPPMTASASQLLALRHTAGVPLCAAALSAGSRDLRELQLSKYALIIGSEGQGVRRELLEAADALAVIPMAERCESLNAAVAAAIFLWQSRTETFT